MNIDDLTVEVRDSSLTKVGRLIGTDLVDSEFVMRFNEVGSWKVKLHGSSPMAAFLSQPGYGIVVTTSNGVAMSGPMVSAKLVQSQEDPDGTWEIEGVDDSVILAERLAYPKPSEADVSAQDVDFDERDGVAETVLKEFVDENLVSGPAVRQVANLTVATDQARGSTVYGRARFDQMQEMFFGLAQTGGLGYEIKQVGTGLVFDVYEPVNRSAFVRLDIENGRLEQVEYQSQAPLVTRAIVAGAGELEDRLFLEGTLAQSTTAETTWGRRIERLIDARSAKTTNELTQKADEALIDDGKTRVSLTITPTDDTTMLYGRDWDLGDTISATVGSTLVDAVVYTVGISVKTDGVYIAAEVGKPTPTTYESDLGVAARFADKRLNEIERTTTGYGVVTTFADVVGGTSGTQPIFDGPVFTAEYTRFGDMVHFAYSVDFDNITSFGTGQYFMTLPYDARRAHTFNGGALYDDSSGNIYSIIGIVTAGSNQMDLYYLKSNGETEPFKHNKPITLTTADNFDITGIYEKTD